MSYSKETIQRYDEIAHYYSSDWRGEFSSDLQIVADHFLHMIGKDKAVLLDAGVGTGKVARYFCELGHSVVGLDLSSGMLREFVANISNIVERQGKPLLGDMREIPLDSRSFDGVWCMASLVHIRKGEKPQVINEFNRVLKPGGVLFISVQNKLSSKHIRRMIESLFFDIGYDEYNKFYRKFLSLAEILDNIGEIPLRIREGYALLDRRHWFFPSRGELIEIVKEAGFEVVEVTSLFSKRISIFARKNE